VKSTVPDRCRVRVRNLGVGLLLLLLPACGLSEYENLMRQTQEREERFRDEKKYLDEPVKVPMRKDKEDHDVAVADMFFRPPKGIQPRNEPSPANNLLWTYPPRSGSAFGAVQLAFAEDNKEFAADVLRNFQFREVQPRVQELQSPGREPLVFDTWEFEDDRAGYSINVLRGARPQVAVVYVFGRGGRESLRKPIELSLESLAFGKQASMARLRFKQQSPWQLRGGRGT
jgi:hypothetical protein